MNLPIGGIDKRDMKQSDQESLALRTGQQLVKEGRGNEQ